MIPRRPRTIGILPGKKIIKQEMTNEILRRGVTAVGQLWSTVTSLKDNIKCFLRGGANDKFVRAPEWR